MSENLQPVLHYPPPDGWLGDIHPLFHGGRWHLYALEVPREPLRRGLARLQSVNIAGTDLVRWAKNPIYSDDAQRSWWAIANIEVGKRIYSYYNGPRGFDLAISKDGRTWQPHGQNPVVPYPENGLLKCRDPFVVFDKPSGRYYLIAAGEKPGKMPPERAGLFLYATSEDRTHWTLLQPLYDPGNIGIPECPELFHLGSHYYLMGSWGVDRVGQGRYRIADRPEGPWRVPEIDTLDATELMAPNTGFDGKRRLFFGWIPTYQEQKDFAPYEWGGHLAFPREVYTDTEGTLFLRLSDEFLALRGRKYQPEPGTYRKIRGDWDSHQNFSELSAGGELRLPGEHRRFELETTLTFSALCSEAGLILRAGGGRFPGYAMTVDRHGQRLELRRHREPGRPLASKAVRIPSGKPIKLRVFVDGHIVEAFLGDRYSLAGRVHLDPGMHQIGFYAEGDTCRIERPVIYTLKPVYTKPLPASVILNPTRPSTR